MAAVKWEDIERLWLTGAGNGQQARDSAFTVLADDCQSAAHAVGCRGPGMRPERATTRGDRGRFAELCSPCCVVSGVVLLASVVDKRSPGVIIGA